MRQGNGTELLGTDDPRVATIGIIYVSPHDDRKSVLAAILTQEKLGRKDVVIDLPGQNTAFARSQDFDDLKKIQRKLQSQIVFIIPRGSGIAEFANQRQFPVFSSFDSYQQAFERHNPLPNEANNIPNGEKRRTFGSKSRTPSALDAALVGGVSGMVVDAVSSYPPQQNSRSGQRNYIPASPTIDDEDALDDEEQPLHAPSPVPGRRTAPPLNNMPIHADVFDDDEIEMGDDEPVVQHPVPGRRTVPPLSRGPISQPELYDDDEDDGDPRDEDDDNNWTTPPPLHSTRPPQIPEDPDKTVDRAELEAAGGAIAGIAAGTLASRSSRKPLEPVNTPPISSHEDDEVEEDDDALPGIIDLQPKKPQRNTKKLSDGPNVTSISDTPNGTTQGAHKRRSGAIDATLTSVAGIAAGAAFNAATTSGQTGGAPSHGAVMRGPARPTSAGNTHAAVAANASGNTGNRKPDRKQRRPIVRLLLILLLLLLLTALIGGLFAHSDPMAFKNVIQPFSNGIPGTSGSATSIAITPSSQQISDNYVIQTVSSGAKADQLQVSQRSLSATPPSQTLTVKGTGQTQTQATQASGTITFFNSNASEETIAAHTVFTLDNGVKVENTEVATIPAADLPTTGEVSVSAIAITTGSAGNIAYKSLFSQNCCGLGGITAENMAPFTGGKDPQNYTFVQQSDVDSATQQVVYTLSQEAITSFKKDLKPTERLIGNPNCPTNVSVDPNTVGDQGKNITSTQVTVSASCTGIAYAYNELQSVANARLPLKATQKLGSAYSLTGNIASSITNVTTQKNGATLLVNAKGTWVYQISTSMQNTWKQLIAGKKISVADSLLEKQTGIARVNIPGKPGDSLPTDPNQISITVLSVPGTPAVATPGNNFNPVEATPTASAINGNGLTPNTKQVA